VISFVLWPACPTRERQSRRRSSRARPQPLRSPCWLPAAAAPRQLTWNNRARPPTHGQRRRRKEHSPSPAVCVPTACRTTPTPTAAESS
jgi:hypothetical protein